MNGIQGKKNKPEQNEDDSPQVDSNTISRF